MRIKLKLLQLCILVVLAAAMGCSNAETTTQVVVSIEADQLLREKLTRVDVESYDPGQVDSAGKPMLVGKQPFEIKTPTTPQGVTFPFSFGAVKNKADEFLLVVVGFEGERVVVEQKARVGFVDGQARKLTIHLSSDCYEKLCAERDTSAWFQSTCDNGTCSGVGRPETVVAGGDEDAGTAHEDGAVSHEAGESSDAQGEAGSANLDSGQTAADAGAQDASSNPMDAGNGQQMDAGDPASDSGAKDTGTTTPDAQPTSCGTQTCPATANCIATPTPHCECKAGYQGSGTSCTNVNDCTAGACAAPSTCVDGLGDFTCTCAASYLQVNAKTCAPGFTSLSSNGDSVGGGTNCAKRANGTVACWGRNIQGQFGNGTEQQINNLPIVVDSLANVAEIAVGSNFVCSRHSDGTVWCAGYNGSGQLGRGVTGDSSVPVQVMGLSGVVELAAGPEHICARRSNGTVACWGDNTSGQLGNGMSGAGVRSLAPVDVAGLSNAVEVAAGVYHNCARRTEAGGGSSVVCWGANSSGQLGNGVTGDNSAGAIVQVSSTVLVNPIGLALGEWHSCALLMNGTMACWGSNNSGQIRNADSNVPLLVPQLTSAVEVAANRFYSCARLMNGSVTCWGGWPGRSDSSPITMVTSGALEIGAGYIHTCVRKSDGNVVCWGENKYGQMGNGTSQGDNDPPVLTATTVKAF